MRKSALIVLLVIVIIFVVVAYFARDRYLESALESTLQAIAGAKVEVDNFHFSLFKLECSWDRLQIANRNDPWRNLLETGRASFDIEGRPLFWRRVIIREMILENARSGTQRASDGSLPKKPEPPPTESKEPGLTTRVKTALQEQLEQLPVLNLDAFGKKFKIDSLIDVNQLNSVQQYHRLTHFADSSWQYWQANVKPEIYKNKIQEIENEVKSLKLDELKDPVALASALKKLDSIYDQLKAMKNEVGEKYQASKQVVDDFEQQIQAAQAALKKDIAQAQQLAWVKDLDIRDVGLILFGEPMVGRLDQLLGYVNTGRKYLPTAKKFLVSEKEESPPRLQGQNIHYPFHYRYPRFLLRQAHFSAATAAGDTSQAYFLSGDLTGLTNEPPVFGRPTRFVIQSNRIGGNQYEISGTFDHVTDVARDSLWVGAKNWGLGQVKLAKSSYLPQSVSASKGNINLAGFFIGDQIDLKLDFTASPVQFQFNDTKGIIARVIQDVLSALKQLEVNLKLTGQKKNYQMQMRSNVDVVLANRLKSILADNLQKARQQVEQYVNAEVEKRRAQALTQVEKYKTQMNQKLEEAQQLVQSKLDEIEKRKQEIQAKIEAEKDKAKKRAEAEKEKLKEKAQDKLDGLLKKKRP